MQNLFIALRDKYPESEVRDVKFVVNPGEVADQDVAEIDDHLSVVVQQAEPLAGPQDLV